MESLNLSCRNIVDINGLDNLFDLQILQLYTNKIKEIKGLDTLTKLKELILYNNNIYEIKGLNNLINLQTLCLNHNNITKITGLHNLINLQKLDLSWNKITKISGLNKLTNLKSLILYNNRITEIEGIDKLVNLKSLILYDNQITEIKGLDNLVNLQELQLAINKITNIQGLHTLVNLQNLNLSKNKIKKIQGLEYLINLQILSVDYNQISELPLELCNLRNIKEINYIENPIEHIPLPIERLLVLINGTIRRVLNNNMVYNDRQNVHNHYIQSSFRNSLANILRDKKILNINIVKQQIINNEILTDITKREILKYCNDPARHTTYLITYADLLTYVWSRISKSNNKPDLCRILNQEINDGIGLCFTGRLTRLLNCLTGFYNDIELQISDSEQITNIIVSLKNKYTGSQLYDKVKAELIDRNYSTKVINEWLEYL